MNYFAFFLDNNNYVEKCLTLIRFISNPEIRTLPHITIRTFEEQNSKLDYTRDTVVSHLDIIEPGTFNLQHGPPPYVVYIKCESDELEEIKYKKDYPFSTLHITIYEGNDLDFANELYELLGSIAWNFRLSFETPRGLYEKRIGASRGPEKILQNIKSSFEEIVKADYEDFITTELNRKSRLSFIKMVLEKLAEHLENNTVTIKKIVPKTSHGRLEQYIDRSQYNITYNNNQLSFDSLHSEKAPFVEKPIQDAIFVTPPEYAREMAHCALEALGHDILSIDFGDSAIGTGALFLAIKHLIDEVNASDGRKYIFNSAIGIDIDEGMATEAFVRCDKHGLTVIYGDAISETMDLGPSRNLMIVNPPYNRHDNIPKEYKQQARDLARKQTGISIRGNAGLYVYHLLIMDKWLTDNGIGVWLLPSIFLQAGYGEAIRQYLLNNVQLIKLHVYDDKKIQFDNTYVSTAIVVFKKCLPTLSSTIALSYGDSVIEPSFFDNVNRSVLQDSSGNWRRSIYNKGISMTPIDCSSSSVSFSDLFEIKRGLATGANSFFVLKPEDAQKNEIPSFALKPLLPKARYLKSQIINSKDGGYPDVEPQLLLIDCDLDENIIKKEYPVFYKYLQTAKKTIDNEKAIIERTLVRSRKPWYKQEKRAASPYLLTYMGRNKEGRTPLYFILNHSNALALNTYILLYPRKWLENLLIKDNALYDILLQSLNSSAELIAQQTRIYSGGLQKLEPNSLKSLPIINLPFEIVEAMPK